MRLTALWLYGTLLALTSFSWTAANSGVGDILGDKSFGPCAATLRREETCRQDESSCPYLFSLPPLTVHLPEQLRELEEIVKDLQMLKDNVDQLRKMCADCTVSQSERECGRLSEKEREKLNENTVRHEDGNKWMDERDPGKLNDCGTDRVKVEGNIEGNGDSDAENRITVDEKERKQWDPEKQGGNRLVKVSEQEEPLKKETEKDGKNQTEGAKATDKLEQAKVPTSGGKERRVDIAKETLFKSNKWDGGEDSNEKTSGKRGSKGEPEDKLDIRQEIKMTINMRNTDKIPESNHDVRQEETEKVPTSLKKEDRRSDGIKMSEERDAHTNKKQQQHSEENKRQTGIKAVQNNEKPKQTENTGSTDEEKAINEGEEEEVDSEMKTEGGETVQAALRDRDGDSASSKATQRTDFVSISPTPQSAIGSEVSYNSLDSNEATAFTSSLPSPHFPSSASHSITDANQQAITAVYGQPTQSTGAVYETTAHAVNPLDGRRQQTTYATVRFISTAGAGFQGHVNSATTTSSHNSDATTSPAVMGRGRWTAKNNSSNTKPLPDRGPKADKKHKPGVSTKADQGQKNTKTYQKPDRALEPNKKQQQKQKPSRQKPTPDLRPTPGKDTKMINISKPDQRTLLNYSTTDRNLTNNRIPTPGQAGTFDKNVFLHQKPDSDLKSVLSVQQQTPPGPSNVELVVPDEYPAPDQQPEYDDISFINQNSEPGKKLHRPPETNRPYQKQTPGRKTTSEEQRKHDHRSEPNHNLTNVGESESESRETTNFTTKFKSNQNENPLSVPESNPDSRPGQKLRPVHTITSPDQMPKTSQKIPKIIPKPKPGHVPTLNQKHPGLVTNQKPKPKPAKVPQTNSGIETPQSDPRPDLKSKTVPDEVPEAESSETVKPRPPTRHRPPTTPVLKPGATRLQRPKLAAQPKPSPKAKGESDLLSSVTTSNINHNSQTVPPPTSGPGKHPAHVTHFLGNPELSRREIRTPTVAPESFSTVGTRAFTYSYSDIFPIIPNNRIPSVVRPPAVGQSSSVPVTTNPNNVISGTSPGSTKPNLSSYTDSSSQPVILHNVEETAVEQSPDPDKTVSPVDSPSSQTSSTVNPDFTSAMAGKTGPGAESSTPSARELRVKINQVAALLNSSLSQHERPLDRGPKRPLEDKQGGRRPDNRQQTLTSPQSKCFDFAFSH